MEKDAFQYMLLLRGATRANPENRQGGVSVSIHAPLARSNFLCCILYI